MAIKLADTLAPMADFPAVEAKDVAFNDNKSLQEKYDNGELGGGGISITVDSAMSDTSTNPVQNKVIKAYVDSKSVDISADLDNAIQNKTDGIYVEKTKISTDDGNALSEKSNGLFVEDLSNKVNALNIAQKTVNEDLEYFSATGTESGTSLPASPNYNFLPYLDTIKTNLDSSRYTTQYITLKAGKTYQLSFGTLRSADSATGSSYHIADSLGNQIGNRGYTGGNYGDNIVDVIYTPTSDIKINPMIVTNATSKYFPDCSFFTVKEVNRTITIDPVEYVDSTKGIEDTPVGHIIPYMGNNAPKHYLICDGREYNIVDYPYLVQHFTNEFGSSNYFGGDGTTTFAVPDLRGEFLRGTGVNSHTNQGSGSNVGVHQDATEHINFGVNTTDKSIWFDTSTPRSGTTQVSIGKTDSDLKLTTGDNTKGLYANLTPWSTSSNYSHYTARPTNTSVLYCIKYEPTYFMKNTYSADSVNYTDEEIREAVAAVLGGTE